MALSGEAARSGIDRVVAGGEAAGQRLDRWLTSRFPRESRARLQSLIEAAAVRVDGHPARPALRLRSGQTIEVEWPEPRPAVPQAEDLPLTIVHEDSELLVVDKPAGIVVHPGAGAVTGTLVNALLHHVRDLSGVGGVLRPGIVHRLDRGTSGLLVVAKNDDAHRDLSRQFAERSVSKEYLALVLGTPRRKEGTIDGAIGRHPVDRKRMSVRPEGGRSARSTYAILEALDGATLLRVRIHTGRTHQIRVHLASLGHPVAGDSVYGSHGLPSCRHAASRAALQSLTRPALHAAHLSFRHPSTGAVLAFDSPLPSDLSAVLERLREPPI
jgi:23S rRNA pseudouridine1911/1915/1917 synthase